jgi:hypothetical protein
MTTKKMKKRKEKVYGEMVNGEEDEIDEKTKKRSKKEKGRKKKEI